jgi:hypothetical protein
MAFNRFGSLILLGFAALGVAFCGVSYAQEKEADLLGDGPLDLSNFPGQLVEGVIIPVPSEIVGVLDKLGESEWSSVIVVRKPLVDKSRRRMAMALGVMVADGLLAVQAHDAKRVEVAGREVLNLATTLGLRLVVAEHCQSIFESAEKKSWGSIKLELDKTQQTVRETMTKMRDEALADLVSLGGWVRGTEAVSGLISNSFTTDKAELLQQLDLVRFFRKSMDAHPAAGEDAELIKEIIAGLDAVVKGMRDEGNGITSAGTQEIFETSALMVDTILKNISKTAAAESGRETDG